jgi:hypothetical protein
MCRHYGIRTTTFDYRIEKRHMPLKEALTSKDMSMMSTAIECTDHLGNRFESKVKMCDYWGMPRTIYFRRIRNGWTQEDALTKPIENKNAKHDHVKDHTGRKYNNINEMCSEWNISKRQYIVNIRNGCSIEEALTTVTEEYPKTYKDHLGNEFSSINEMCRYHGVTKTTLRSRMELGWTLREVFENPGKKKPNTEICDHLGNRYDSINDMLEHYGVPWNNFRHRTKKGYSMEECLQNKSIHDQPCEDHMGHKFERLKDMFAYWNFPSSLYYSRHIEKGWSIEKTLTTIPKSRYKTFGNDIEIIKPVEEEYYEVKMNGESMIMSAWQLCMHKNNKNKNTKENEDYDGAGTRKQTCPVGEKEKELR